jgi:hypothetical protein
MTSERYKDHTILVHTEYDSLDKTWSANIAVIWKAQGRERVRSIRTSKNRFSTRREAEAFGIDKGKAWVNSTDR